MHVLLVKGTVLSINGLIFPYISNVRFAQSMAEYYILDIL
jgi:hypothetical protein